MDTATIAVATTIRDIKVSLACTPRDLWQAQRLVAEGYALLSEPPLDVDEVYQEFYPAGASFPLHDRDHCMSTFIARCDDQIVATISLIWCQSRECSRRYDQIEGLRLMRPEHQWSAVLGFAPNEIAELTRLAIHRAYQGSRDTVTKLHLFRLLMYRALDLADRKRVGVVLAVMPPTVTRLMAQVGVTLRQVDKVALAHEDPDCAALYKRYPRYWLPMHTQLMPQLYIFGDRAGVD